MKAMILIVVLLWTIALALVASQLDVSAQQAPTCATSGSFSQGERTCFVDSATKCGTIGCSPLTVAQTCMVCSTTTQPGTPNICEASAPSGCTVNVGIHCSVDVNNAQLGRWAWDVVLQSNR